MKRKDFVDICGLLRCVDVSPERRLCSLQYYFYRNEILYLNKMTSSSDTERLCQRRISVQGLPSNCHTSELRSVFARFGGITAGSRMSKKVRTN